MFILFPYPAVTRLTSCMQHSCSRIIPSKDALDGPEKSVSVLEWHRDDELRFWHAERQTSGKICTNERSEFNIGI